MSIRPICEPQNCVLSDFFWFLDIVIGIKKETQKLNSAPRTKRHPGNLTDHGTTHFRFTDDVMPGLIGIYRYVIYPIFELNGNS